MQAGSVTLGSTTGAVFGPLAGASHVVLVRSGSGNAYAGASAGLSPSTDRANLCLLKFSDATDGYLAFRMGEGETLYAATDIAVVIDYMVFPE